MAKLFMLISSKSLIICLLVLLATYLASSARLLDEVNPQIPAAFDPIAPPETEPPIATATVPTTNVAPIPDPSAPEEPAPVTAPVPDITTPPLTTTAPPVTTPAAAAANPTTARPTNPISGAVGNPSAPEEPAAPVIAPVPGITTPPLTTTTTPPVTTPAAAAVNPTTAGPTNPISGAVGNPTFSFFMHDILGGSHPSGRSVAGIAANSDANNQLPFSKPSNPIFPINGGVPLNTVNGVINDNNFPSLVGLNGGASGTNTIVQSNGNNAVPAGNNNQAFVTAGQLPAGLTVQQLMFGSVTVVDNEITEGHELGSGVLGNVQGFYLTSSSDGSSHTLSLTACFHGGEHEHDHEIVDTISFFGVHRTATPISHIAIIGGTGKYENGKGYATIETLPHVDQHTTDGLETITHFTVYLTP